MSDNPKNGTKPDISDLVDRARQEVKTFRPPGTDRKERPAWVNPAAGVAAVAGIAAALYVAAPWIVGYSDAALQAGLTTLATEARSEVEGYRRANGKLPGALPNVALAMAVEYLPQGDDYRLRASDGRRVVEMDARGTVTVSGSR